MQSSNYWSATSDANNASNAWVVNFVGGVLYNKANNHFVWCARGGMNADAY